MLGTCNWKTAGCITQHNYKKQHLFIGTSLIYFILYFTLQQFISIMEVKLKRQDFIHAVRSLQIVEKLPRTALQEFCKVFKVDEGNNDYACLVRGFQAKIVDIICQQGQGYEDYLQLPKFRVMGHDLNERMHTLFRRVWDQQQHMRRREQVNLARRELEDLTPNFQTTDHCSQFHLGLLNLYRSSSLCPKNLGKIQKKEQELKATPTETSNFMPVNNNLQNNAPMANQVGPNMFPYFPFPPPTAFPKVEAQEGMTYIVENKQPQQLFEMPRYPMQQQQFNPQLEFFPPIDPKRMFPQKKQDPRLKQNPPFEKLFGQDSTSSIIQKFINYPFVQCVCQAKKGFQDGFSFKCISCHYSYHYSCLKAQGSATEVAACPLCILRKNTIFCQVIKEPLKFSWYFQEKQGRDLKVQLTMQQSQQVHEACKKGYQCQIRFLKIDGKSFKKDRKPLDGFTTEGGVLQKQIKHSEIILPQFSQQRKQPIALQIMLRNEDERDPSTKLYFFAVFLSITKQVNDIVKDLFSSNKSQSLSYYNDFMDQTGKVQVNLKSTNHVRGLIKFPVRGINCRHAEVFDFKIFLELVSDLKRDKQAELSCPICTQSCPSFKFDAFINNCIQDFPEYEDKKPEGIQIERNGQHAWVLDNPPQHQAQEQKINGEVIYGDNFMVEEPESEEQPEQQGES